MNPKTLLLAISTLLIASGCGGSGTTPTGPDPALKSVAPPPTTATTTDPLPAGAQIVHPSSGMAEGALGIYFLVRDVDDPSVAHLEMSRTAELAQGDLYALSIRPYMTPESLTLVGSAPVDSEFVDYTLRFKHPFDVPADFDPPATAAKRLDLFIFDVNLVVAIAGDRNFFNGNIRANVDKVGTMNGYRMLGPMVDFFALGIIDGTNAFPYRLIHRIDGSNPGGNYGTDGWIQQEFNNATGYDVIPQGSSADGTVRISNTLPLSVPIIVIAKYMDPRNGADTPTKRANRLPNADPANLRYYLPEAAGDIQSLRITVSGAVKDNSSVDSALLTVSILDWDNASPVTPSFPDATNLNAISELSKPTQIEASFPDLQAFAAYQSPGIGAPSGLLNEYVDASIPVINVDNLYTAPATGGTVTGLVRVRDTQDTTNPGVIMLDEKLAQHPVADGFEPATRFQKTQIPITTGRIAPKITAATPMNGLAHSQATFTTVNSGGPATTWLWGFGGGATPTTSTSPSPTVTLGSPGVYSCLARATNSYGTQDFYFSLTVEQASPVITDVTLSASPAYALRNCTFTPVNTGEVATDWAWDFGGGATPNTSTAEKPLVKLGKPGTYTGKVTASNSGGSQEYQFQFTPVTKKIGLRVQAITNGTTLPTKLYGMSAWDLDGLKAWTQAWINGPFRDAGVEIDLNLVELVLVNNPSLFNISTNNEANQVFNLALSQNPNKLNAVAVNSCPLEPGLGGVMTDGSSGCNPNNSARGCWIIGFNDPWDRVVLPHELGHVMNLPHVRTDGPLNSNNYNLMSYGTLDNSLSAAAVREEATSCITYFGPAPVNQFQVSNDWVHTYM